MDRVVDNLPQGAAGQGRQFPVPIVGNGFSAIAGGRLPAMNDVGLPGDGVAVGGDCRRAIQKQMIPDAGLGNRFEKSEVRKPVRCGPQHLNDGPFAGRDGKRHIRGVADIAGQRKFQPGWPVSPGRP